MDMEGKMAIVGSGDGIMLFQAAGVKPFPAANAKEAREQLRRAAQEYSVILLTEEYARDLGDLLKRFDEAPFPVVLPIPSGDGESGYGEELLKDVMKRALGVDILYQK